MPSAKSPEPGRVIGGYRLERPLGRGGMAEVWLGKSLANESLAAIKILRPHSGERIRNFFEREQRAVLRLNHPNIVPVFDVGDEFITTAFVEGVDLRHRMRSPMRPAEAISIACDIGSALSAAHDEGVVHCDVKPANILLDRSGTPFLADFGIARVAEDEALASRERLVAGTPAYMAPEQTAGEPSSRSDQYGLAKTLLAMLGGDVRAETSEALEDLGEPLHDALAPALSRGLAPEPEDRFEDVKTFVRALKEANVEDAEAPARIAVMKRDPKPFAWLGKPHAVHRFGEHIERADYRLAELVDAGLLDSAAADDFRKQTGYAEFGWSVYARDERLGPLTEGGAALARARETIVLLHGLFTDREVWRDVSVGVARNNGLAVVLTPDLMGFGESTLSRPDSPSLTPPGLIDALKRWLELIGLGAAPTITIGHSISAASLMCARSSELGGRAHRVCITPALFFHRWDLRWIARLNAVMAALVFWLPGKLKWWAARYLFQRDPSLVRIRPSARDDMARSAVRLGARAVARLFWHVADARPAPPEELSNCVVVTTHDDPLVTADLAVASIRAAGIPDSRWFRLVYGGHFPHLVDELHPEWGARSVHELVSLIDSVLEMTRATEAQDERGPSSGSASGGSDATTATM